MPAAYYGARPSGLKIAFVFLLIPLFRGIPSGPDDPTDFSIFILYLLYKDAEK